MGWITTRLGNGKWGTVDGDDPANPPQVNFHGTITTNPELTQDFGRILNEQFHNNEEIRIDRPYTYDNTFEYIAVAPSGSNTSEAIWNCIRISWVANRQTRIQFRSNVVYDDRTQGWL